MFKKATQFLILSCIIVATLSLTFSGVDHQKVMSHMMTIHNSAHLFQSHLDTVDTNVFIEETLKTIKAINASIDTTKQTVIPTSGVQSFAYGPQTCKALKPEDKTMLAANASDVKTRLKNLAGKAKSQTTKNDAENGAFYLQTMEKLLKQDCTTTQVNVVGPTPMQTNINTQQQWVLGSLSLTNLVQAYFDRYQNNNNVSTCDTKTPFFNGLKCIKCQSPTPIFNISSSKCTSCPVGTVYDQPTKQCVSGDKSSKPNVAAATPNILISAPLGQKDIDNYLAGSGIQCPKEKPFINGTDCVQCLNPTPLFDLNTKKCSSCPNGVDPTTHICKAATAKTYKPNPAGKDNIQLQPKQNDTDLQNYLNTPGDLCPADKPYSTGSSCIQCSNQTPYFSITTKSCMSCQLNTTTHKCNPTSSTAPFPASKPRVVLSGNLTKVDLDKYYASSGTQCPSDKPFFDGKACLQCSAPTPLFDLATKKCVSCVAPATFNQDTQKCQQSGATDVDKYDEKLMLNADSQDIVWDNYVKENQNKLYCPADKPFWNKKECIACPDNFNVVTYKCDVCPEAQALDSWTHKCGAAEPLSPSLLDLFNSIA